MRGDLEPASALADEAMAAGVSVDAPVALLPWITGGMIHIMQGRHDEGGALLVHTIQAFDAAGANDFQRSNLLAVSSTWRSMTGDLDATRETRAKRQSAWHAFSAIPASSPLP